MAATIVYLWESPDGNRFAEVEVVDDADRWAKEFDDPERELLNYVELERSSDEVELVRFVHGLEFLHQGLMDHLGRLLNHAVRLTENELGDTRPPHPRRPIKRAPNRSDKKQS